MRKTVLLTALFCMNFFVYGCATPVVDDVSNAKQKNTSATIQRKTKKVIEPITDWALCEALGGKIDMSDGICRL